MATEYKNFKKRIEDDKINAFCKKEFGTLPKSAPMPADVYHENDDTPVEERFVNISRKCYGQACSLEDAGYMVCRFEMFL